MFCVNRRPLNSKRAMRKNLSKDKEFRAMLSERAENNAIRIEAVKQVAVERKCLEALAPMLKDDKVTKEECLKELDSVKE